MARSLYEFPILKGEDWRYFWWLDTSQTFDEKAGKSDDILFEWEFEKKDIRREDKRQSYRVENVGEKRSSWETSE